MIFIEKAKSVVIGHAVADALGVPVEFMSREELKETPVTDMTGYGTYPVPKGAWSDDTSMSLCALDCLDKENIDWDNIMLNFEKWLLSGEFTPTGETFDAGRTCVNAISNYFRNGLEPTQSGLIDEMSNGNGSLMRIHPFVLYLYNKEIPIEEKISVIEQASSLTHAHERSRMACGIYAFVLWELLKKPCMDSICVGLRRAQGHYIHAKYEERHKYTRLFHYGQWLIRKYSLERAKESLSKNEIKSSGYVVDTLEAAIWCLLTTESYEECVLKAVNLGEDTDTVAAVAGGLAGALYGYNAIPQKWRDTLIKREYIEALCDKAYKEKE